MSIAQIILNMTRETSVALDLPFELAYVDGATVKGFEVLATLFITNLTVSNAMCNAAVYC